MRLYLVRHGQADHGPIDVERHLSKRGRLDVEAMAQYLSEQGVTAGRVVHSGLVRAFETAQVLAALVSPDKDVSLMPGIEPWGSVDEFAKVALGWDQDTMVCGHEPFMGNAAMTLQSALNPVMVETGTVMAFERSNADTTWKLLWAVSPRTIGGPA